MFGARAFLSFRRRGVKSPPMKVKWSFAGPIILMILLAVSMWPGMSGPFARALGLGSGENFSAAYALAFCAGVYFPNRVRFILPLAVFLVINVMTNVHYGFPLVDLFLVVKIAALAALIALGTFFSTRNHLGTLIGGGLLGAIIFYIATNTASWLFDPAYPKTLGGWLQALTMGRPEFPATWTFFLNSLLSGGIFTGLFAGAMKLASAPKAEEDESEEEEEAPADPAADPLPEESKA